MNIDSLPNGGIRARVQLPDSPWLGMLPEVYQRHARGPSPSLALPHPLAVAVLLLGVAWLAAVWDQPHAFAFVRPEGVARRQHGHAAVGILLAIVPLFATFEWRILQPLRGRSVTLVAAAGQLLVVTDGRRTPDVDAPLAACRLERDRHDLVVHHPDGVARYHHLAAPHGIEALIAAIAGVSP